MSGHLRGVAVARSWPLYSEVMTDPDDRPSCLFVLVSAFAYLVTFSAVLFQLVMALKFFVEKLFSHTGKMDADAVLCVGIYPTLAYLVVAVLYHLVKGKPTTAGSVVTFFLYSVWSISVIGGAIYSYLI
jgi:hypothetical protein